MLLQFLSASWEPVLREMRNELVGSPLSRWMASRPRLSKDASIGHVD